MYKVRRTNRFNKEVEKLSNEEIKRVNKLIEQLKENPYVGDQLQIKILREKKLEEKRIYYLIFDDLNAILIIAISNKKAQQKEIDFAKDNINNYKEYLRRLLSNDEN